MVFLNVQYAFLYTRSLLVAEMQQKAIGPVILLLPDIRVRVSAQPNRV